MIRLFAALQMPKNIHEQCLDICYGVRNIRFIKKNIFHCTLRFFGECREIQYRDIVSALKTIQNSNFVIRLKSVGVFPTRKKPNILYIGIETSQELTDLQRKIEKKAQSLGFDKEQKSFIPHITIGRFAPDAVFTDCLDFLSREHLFQTEYFTVSEFHLFKSVLQQSGAEYIKEATFHLS